MSRPTIVTVSVSTDEQTGQRNYRALVSGQPVMADTSDRAIAENVAIANYVRLGTAHKLFTVWDGDSAIEKILFEDLPGFPLRHKKHGTALYNGKSPIHEEGRKALKP